MDMVKRLKNLGWVLKVAIKKAAIAIPLAAVGFSPVIGAICWLSAGPMGFDWNLFILGSLVVGLLAGIYVFLGTASALEPVALPVVIVGERHKDS